jgi:hypothetical protein
MTEATNIGARLVPALLARDMGETLSFYRRLGFRLTGCHPDQSNPVWAEVQRDSATLQFHTDPPSGTPPPRCVAGPSTCFRQASWTLRKSFTARSRSPGAQK